MKSLIYTGIAVALLASLPHDADAAKRKTAKKSTKAAAKKPAKKPTKKPVKAVPRFDDSWSEGIDEAPVKAAPANSAVVQAIPITAPKAAKDDSGNLPIKKNADGTIKTGVLITPVTRNNKDSAETIELAQNGKALVPIVISANASATMKLVADDLKATLDRMTGASFEIKVADVADAADAAAAPAAGLVLGTMKEFPTPALRGALEIVNAFDGKEAFAIRTTQKRVLLLGATDKGASHAAYRFLKEMGCRWFFQSDEWQVVPSIKNLKFARDITDRPSFLSRDIWYAWYLFGDAGHPKSTPEKPRSAGGDFGDWNRHNSMGGSFTANAGHAYEAIIRENAAEFEKHPEYLALVGGKRQGQQLEIGNPALVKLVCDWAVDYFKKNPNSDMVSVDPADGGGMSESEESKKLGTASDNAFYLANQVAKALQKAYPGQNKMVGLYAYNWHSDPPPFALEPNVYVQLTMGFIHGKMTLEQLFEEWPKRAKNLGFYDYYSTWRWDYDMWPGGRIGNKAYPISMIRKFQEINSKSGAYATSVSAESGNNWGLHGRTYYLASQLLWNPDADPEAILDDFYEKAFGPAAKEMKRYYDLQDNVPPMSPGVKGEIFRRIMKARDAARKDPAAMRRIDDISNYLHYYDMGARESGTAEEKAARPMEAVRTAYRTRYSYMNHWQAIMLDGAGKPAADGSTPWKDETPVTHEETEAWMQEAVKSYPDLVIPDLVKFTGGLVPVNLGGEPKEFVSQSIQGGSQEMAFYSLRGEPIRATLRSYAMYGGPKQSYQVLDENGKVLSSGNPTGTEKGTVTEINQKVAKPGRYTIKYSDGSGSLWSITVPASQPFAFMTDKLNGSTALYGRTPDLYFYVPKGVKEINYYFSRTPWSNSGPHDVISPDGKIQKSVEIGADYVSVPVPAGMDGKAWRFGSPEGKPQGFGLGYFHFFNVPDLLSPSPAQMLLPEDLVKKDGLKRIG